MRAFMLLLLLAANAGYFAWTSGWLRDWGLAPATQAEPQRLAQQIRPEALRITGNDADVAPAAATNGANPAPITVARTTTTAITSTTRSERSVPPADGASASGPVPQAR